MYKFRLCYSQVCLEGLSGKQVSKRGLRSNNIIKSLITDSLFIANDAEVVLMTSVSQHFAANCGINVFPSPNQGRFTINCTAGNARIDIFNTMGQLVFTRQLKEGNNSIDLSHLNSGMYFAMVSGNEIINQKTTIIITE